MSMTLERMQRQAKLLKQPDVYDGDDFAALLDYERRRWEVKHRILQLQGDPTATFLTGTNVETIYRSLTAGTAKNTFTTEVGINDSAGMGKQAFVPAHTMALDSVAGRVLRIVGRGILSSTATPTYTFTIRSGAAASITTAILLGSAALTTGSGVTNQMYELEGEVVLTVVGAPGTNSTVRGTGLLASGGLASPFSYPIWGGAATPGTVATFDTAIDNYINFNVACSASSASNTITLQQLFVFGMT